MAVNTEEKIRKDWEDHFRRSPEEAFQNLLDDYLFLLHHPSVGGRED